MKLCHGASMFGRVVKHLGRRILSRQTLSPRDDNAELLCTLQGCQVLARYAQAFLSLRVKPCFLHAGMQSFSSYHPYYQSLGARADQLLTML